MRLKHSARRAFVLALAPALSMAQVPPDVAERPAAEGRVAQPMDAVSYARRATMEDCAPDVGTMPADRAALIAQLDEIARLGPPDAWVNAYVTRIIGLWRFDHLQPLPFDPCPEATVQTNPGCDRIPGESLLAAFARKTARRRAAEVLLRLDPEGAPRRRDAWLADPLLAPVVRPPQ